MSEINVIVTLNEECGIDDAVGQLEALGLRVSKQLRRAGIVIGRAPAAQRVAIETHPAVLAVEEDAIVSVSRRD